MNDRNDPANCFNCGKLKEQNWNWFCNRCTAAKEKAYQECREAGIVEFGMVLFARDKALAEARASDQTIEVEIEKLPKEPQDIAHDQGL